MSSILYILFILFYILFVPGFLISYLFFKPEKIDWIERFALSFALSIAAVPLVVFYTNLLGVEITQTSVLIQILLLMIVVSIVLFFIYGRELLAEGSGNLYYKKHIPEVADEPVKYAKPKPQIAKYLHVITKELFQISLITYLILLLTETIKTGFVSYFFDLNILLGVVLVSGVVMAITHYEESRQIVPIKWTWDTLVTYISLQKGKNVEKKLSEWDRYFILAMSIGGGLLVYYKTPELKVLSLVISLATMVIIGLLSYMILTEKE